MSQGRFVLGLLVTCAAIAGVAIGCSSFGGDEPGDGADAAVEGTTEGEGSVVDGASGDGATPDATFDAHIPIAGAFLDDSFETAMNVCSGWQNTGAATAFPDPNAKTGTRGCMVCVTATGDGMTKKVMVSARPTYQGLAWVKAAPGSVGATAALELQLRAGAVPTGAGLGRKVLSTEWQQVQAVANAVDGGTSEVQLFVSLDTAGAAGCVYVDDVSLTGE